MFVFSWKPGRGKMLLAGIGVLLVVGAAFWLPRWKDSGAAAATEDVPFHVEASTDQERIDFLAQFGWEVEPEPLETRELTIPQEFNDVYRNYNEIQKAQGMDLAPYAGKQCYRWTYRVTNYPDTPQEVRANLLVYEGKVIGGDLCSVELDGFLCSFDGTVFLPDWQASGKEDTQEQTAESSTGTTEESSSVVQELETMAEIPDSAWPTD